ncbi:MAG: glycosyltransferase family 2 protein [Lachnospiraceae bacterium]|nr:glycosyltransferase family 2 protein [Lachnospiraceae bacterium]
MKSLNIVIPIYNDQDCVSPFYDEVERVMGGMQDPIEWMLTFVVDLSRDDTLPEIKRLEKAHGSKVVRYIANSKRFGKDASIYAGLKTSNADYTAVMDCDLQDPPSLIPEMITAIESEGYDCVATYRKDRKGEPILRSAFSRMFYVIMNKSSTKMKQGARDFRLMNRDYVNAVLALCERERFTKGIFSWVGFNTKWIPFENIERTVGVTNMSFKSLYADAIGAIISFSAAPLRMAIMFGGGIIAFAFVYVVFVLVKVLLYGTNYSGANTIIVWLMFSTGFIIFLLGIIGEYLSRIYFEVKRRPIYIIRETNIEDIDKIGL